MCCHQTISVFILPYRPDKANRKYVWQKDIHFDKHIFYICGDFRLIFVTGFIRNF